ncbi:hypothetical protein Avbf_16031, partial [Armadillidium vulgare]
MVVLQSECFNIKESTRKEAYESCKNLSSSLLSEKDIRKLIHRGQLGRLWTAYNLNSQGRFTLLFLLYLFIFLFREY